MKANELKKQLIKSLEDCTYVNDSFTAKVDLMIQWAWENWPINFTPYYDGDEKPIGYTESFRDEWIDNEDFTEYLENLENLESE